MSCKFNNITKGFCLIPEWYIYASIFLFIDLRKKNEILSVRVTEFK